MLGIALIKALVVGQQSLAVCGILVGTQHGAGKTAALHLQQLVDQHIAVGPDVALEATSAQHERLTERSAIGEFGKVQINALHTIESHAVRIGIVGQLQDVCALGISGGG